MFSQLKKNLIFIFFILFSFFNSNVLSEVRYHDHLKFSDGVKTEFRAINDSGIITITVEAIGLIDFNRSVSSHFPIKEIIPNTHISTIATGTCNDQNYPLRVAFFKKRIFIQSLAPTINDCNTIKVDPFTIQWVSSW